MLLCKGLSTRRDSLTFRAPGGRLTSKTDNLRDGSTDWHFRQAVLARHNLWLTALGVMLTSQVDDPVRALQGICHA